MTATTPTFEREWLALGSGQTGLHWLAAGTTLVALEGTLRLEPPSRWGAGVRYTLGAGHAHVVETSGWWHLHADAGIDAHLRIVVPPLRTHPRPWLGMWRWLAHWIQPRQTSHG